MSTSIISKEFGKITTVVIRPKFFLHTIIEQVYQIFNILPSSWLCKRVTSLWAYIPNPRKTTNLWPNRYNPQYTILTGTTHPTYCVSWCEISIAMFRTEELLPLQRIQNLSRHLTRSRLLIEINHHINNHSCSINMKRQAHKSHNTSTCLVIQGSIRALYLLTMKDRRKNNTG